VDNKVYEIKESSIADPGALGTAGFAMTTMALSLVNAQLVPATMLFVFLPLALFYGGFAQVLAGMWEFKKNNTFGATVFSSYGGFWIALALMLLFATHGTISFGKNNADLGTALGFYLLLWTIPTVYFLVASFKTNNVLVFTFIVLIVAFIALDIGNLGASTGATIVGGYFGILAALGAWYASAASVVNFAFQRTVLPVGPRS